MDLLVDASVWVDHSRHRNAELVAQMALDRVLIPPFVLTELACGTPPAPRKRTLSDLALQRPARQASQTEVQDFIERERLYGLGCGWVDITLLASVLMTPDTRLWTSDKRLAGLEARFGIEWAMQAS